jgi:hypothetical protein
VLRAVSERIMGRRIIRLRAVSERIIRLFLSVLAFL